MDVCVCALVWTSRGEVLAYIVFFSTFFLVLFSIWIINPAGMSKEILFPIEVELELDDF